MARGTPKRAGKESKAGTLFPSEVLASNTRKFRVLADLTQEDLGQRMAGLGHEWSAGIVGFVERGDRAVSVDELVGLAVAFEASPGDLLDPRGPEQRRNSPGLDVGGPETLPPMFASHWMRRLGQLHVTWDDDGVPRELVHMLTDEAAAEEYFGSIGTRDDESEEDR